MEIKKISRHDNFFILSRLLNESFQTVADEFGLTRENNPTNNAFITDQQLQEALTPNREFYGCFTGDACVGFIALEKSSREGEFYIEKLAVSPNCRHKGIGKMLMDFTVNRIKELGGYTVSIGLINSNDKLKLWYAGLGFNEYAVKTFDHLPFDVCLMSRRLML